VNVQIRRTGLGEQPFDRGFQLAPTGSSQPTIIASPSKARSASMRRRSCSGTSPTAS
jgi:hypothetical protein